MVWFVFTIYVKHRQSKIDKSNILIFISNMICIIFFGEYGFGKKKIKIDRGHQKSVVYTNRQSIKYNLLKLAKLHRMDIYLKFVLLSLNIANLVHKIIP